MTEQESFLEGRLTAIERRLSDVEVRLQDVVDGLNDPPKRSLRHRFASIHQLQEQVVEVDQSFHKLIDELHTPPK